MMILQSSSDTIIASDTRWAELIEELKGLLGESHEIAGQAHFLLATIYYESDPEAPASTPEYSAQYIHHKQKADELLPETADSYLLRAISAATVPKALEHLDRALALDYKHMESIKTRFYIHHACSNFRQMAPDATKMKMIKPEDSLGYSFSAITQCGLGWYEEALADHEKAIQLAPDDTMFIEQRYQTYTHMEDYGQALVDAKECTRLEPSVNRFQRQVFFCLVALGRYDEASQVYDDISAAYDFRKEEFADWSTQEVFNALADGRSWHAPDSVPTGKAFVSMLLADESYRHLARKAKRLVSQGAHPSFSPDGTRFAYSLGVLRSTGIAIYDLSTQQSHLLAIPGKEAAWSPDDQYIAYNRNRRILPFSVLSRQSPMKGVSEQENRTLHEIWVIRADGTEDTRFIAKGYLPSWSSDSKRVFYHSYADADKKVYSKPIDGLDTEPTPIMSRSFYKAAFSPKGDRIAHPYRDPNAPPSESGLRVVDLAGQVIDEHKTEFPMSVLNWSPNANSLLLNCHMTMGGLWSLDLNSKSLTRLFRDYSFGHAEYSPKPADSRLVFDVNTQKTLWHHEIWMADDVHPVDGQDKQAESCHSLTTHHREVTRSHFDRRIELDPDDPMNYLLRARRHLDVNDVEKALMDVEHFARIEQSSDLRKDESLNRRLKYIMVRKRFFKFIIDKIIEKQGETIDVGSPGLNGLAWSFYYEGVWAQWEADYEKAIDFYQTAIKINPALAVAYDHLADVQATCPTPQFRASEQALQNAYKACELTDWHHAHYIETYAAALANAEDFSAAIRWQKEAINKLASAEYAGSKAQFQAKLNLYQEKQPYHQQYLWPSKLIAWWRIEKDDRERLRDHSGNNLHGRFMGDASVIIDSDRGAVLSLDGEGDFVDCGNHSMFDLTDALSVAVWIKPRVLNKKYQTILCSGDKAWLLLREAYTNHMQLSCYGVRRIDDPGSLWGHIPGEMNVSDGQWHHLVGVYDGSSLSLYGDGKLDARIKATGRISKNEWNLFIGENSELPNREWNGLIDDVRVYSYALTPDEVTKLYLE